MEDKDRFDALVKIVEAGGAGPAGAEEFTRYLIDNASVVVDALHILKTSPLFGVRTPGRREAPAGRGVSTVAEPVSPPVAEEPVKAEDDEEEVSTRSSRAKGRR